MPCRGNLFLARMPRPRSCRVLGCFALGACALVDCGDSGSSSLAASVSRPPLTVRRSGSVRVVTISHGTKLSVSVKRRVYPRDALVRAYFSMRNVSPHTLSVNSGNGVEVVTGQRRVVFPPALSTPGPTGGGLSVAYLRPGKRIGGSQLVILRAGYIIEAVSVGGNVRLGVPGVGVVTPALHLTLTAPDRPTFVLKTSPQVLADLQFARGFRGGRIEFTQFYQCGEPPHELQVGSSLYGSWTIASSLRFRPGCAHPVRWQLIAGAIDHSVVTLNYSK